jgi:hypothetical protein
MHGGVAMKTAVLFLFSLPLIATTYYVDASGGSDSNGGSSTTAAWKTVSKVNSSSFSPGDKILFKCDQVWRERLRISSGGSAGKPITFGQYTTSGTCNVFPTFDGTTVVANWTLDSGSIYYAPWTFPSNAVWQNDTTHIRKAISKASMTAGTFFYDGAASRLYVWTTTGANPSGFTIEATTNGPQYLGLILGQAGKDYIIIDGLRVIKTNYFGIQFEESGHHVVRNNILERTYHSSIQIAGQLMQINPYDISVTNNIITDSGVGRGTSGAESECVGINAQAWQTGVVSYNRITNQGGEGIQVLAGATNVTVEHNVIRNPAFVGVYAGAGYGNGGDTKNLTVKYNYVALGPLSQSQGYAIHAETNADNVDGVFFHHNTFIGKGTGIGGLLFGNAQFAGVIKNSVVAHNVFYNDAYGIIAAGPSSGANIHFYNNIMYVTAFGRAYWVSDINRSNYNIDSDVVYGPNMGTFIYEWGTGTLYTLPAFKTNTKKGINSLAVDPLFTNASAYDFTLQPSSPAIDAGRALTAVEQARYGLFPDIGGYEWAPGKLGTSNPTKLRNRHKASVYP